MRRRAATSTAWLSVTPEPERLLPAAVATLRAGGTPAAAAVARERDALERLVRRARLRAWLGYLRRAHSLAQAREEASDPEVASARELALELIDNHRNLLLGLPGRAARLAGLEREQPQPRSERR